MTKIACVGAGQLAQMLGIAATELGITLRSAGKPGSCAFITCEAFTEDITDDLILDNFLNGIDVFTFESEHEGLEYADRITALGVPIYPSPAFVHIAGDRLHEKTSLNDLGIPVAPFELIQPDASPLLLEQYFAHLMSAQDLSPLGIVIKTRHGGYDGKGQWVIRTGENTDFARVVKEIAPVVATPGCIVEGLVDFSMECSILASRSRSGEIKTWPLTHNIHADSILRYSTSPITDVPNIEKLEEQAIDIVTKICTEHDYVGTIAVECFVTSSGLVVNEIAPRVHNSGHWTIEGSSTSQFEQHVRAITGMELGDTTCPGFVSMFNLIGQTVNSDALDKIEGVFLHWYGKEVRPARKVGHITIIGSTKSELESREQKVKAILNHEDLR
ncbi:MAG TPA: 5-(carboxyamino)imidazole ribonucleotide synthase [Acidimicrobiia bacterium]|nr:5-(carboxyamino)imidazole ribonucleotide synthase [Acidimicrobiia bacterium]